MFVSDIQQMLWTGWYSQPADFWRREFTWIQLDRSICHRRPSLIFTASIWKISSTNMIKAPLEPLPSSFFLPHCIFITDEPASYAMFAKFVSAMLHLFPFKHLQASLSKRKCRGERRREIKSTFAQLKLYSNFIWMEATFSLHHWCSIHLS